MKSCKHSIWQLLGVVSAAALLLPVCSVSGETEFSDPAEYMVEGDPVGTVSADFDRQNGPDLAIAHGPGTISLFLNNGDGTFGRAQVLAVSPIRTGRPIIATADMDGVNGPDLVATEYDSKSIAVYLNDGSGRLIGPSRLFLGSDATIYDPAIGDFDGRNGPDVVVVQGDFNVPGLNRMFVAFNQGDGSVASPVEYPLGLLGPHEVGVGDFDGELGDDIVVSNRDHRSVSVFLNTGGGSFGPPTRFSVGGDGPEGVVSADIDRRNGPDIVVAIFWNRVGVLLNRGDGTFAPGVGYDVGNKCIGVDAADFDGDGDNDLVAARADETSLAYLENRGDGSFQTYTTIYIGGGTRRVIAADVDQLHGPDVIADRRNNVVGSGYEAVALSQTIRKQLFIPGIAGATFKVTVDEASPTYPIGWHDYGATDFVSRTTDPLGPFSGVPVQFKGMHFGGQDLIARYRLEFDEPVILDTVSIQGTAWRDDVVRILDEDMSIMATADAAADGNPFQSVVIKAPREEGRVFYLEEFNSDTDWRYRSSIHINLVSTSVAEVTVRTTPYWRSVGNVDLTQTNTVFVAVMSGGPIDPTTIVYDSIVVGDFPRSSLRGVSYGDKNGDGMPDYNFWYRLDRGLVLECREYNEPFTAVTDDGQQVTGRLRFDVVGCTP